MEILLHIIIEPLFFAYYDLVNKFVGKKQLKKWQENLLKVSCLIVSMISFFLVLIGAFWITDVEPFKTYGTIFLIVGGSILFIHILIGLFAGTNHFIEERRKEKNKNNNAINEDNPTPRTRFIDTNNNDDNS